MGQSGTDVRFGSLADVCSATGHVRFTPDSDRESPAKDHVRFASESGHVRRKPSFLLWAKSGHRYSITSSARERSDGGTARPSARAAFKLMAKTTFVDCSTGRSEGFSPLSIRSTYPAAAVLIDGIRSV
jgi:hypothetical protein